MLCFLSEAGSYKHQKSFPELRINDTIKYEIERKVDGLRCVENGYTEIEEFCVVDDNIDVLEKVSNLRRHETHCVDDDDDHQRQC